MKPYFDCSFCDCYDEDYGCSMPSIDKVYACPLNSSDDLSCDDGSPSNSDSESFQSVETSSNSVSSDSPLVSYPPHGNMCDVYIT